MAGDPEAPSVDRRAGEDFRSSYSPPRAVRYISINVVMLDASYVYIAQCANDAKYKKKGRPPPEIRYLLRLL